MAQSKEFKFKGQSIFIGIDVHKKSWEVAILTETGFSKRFSQPPSAASLFEFLSRHFPGGNYQAVYESGFCGYSVYYSLMECGINCIIVNASDVPTTQYEETMKTDRIDAKKLAASLKAGLLKPIYICEKDRIDDRSVVRIRKTIQEEFSSWRVRVKHLLHTNGVELPECFSNPGTHWSQRFMRWLKLEVRLMSSTRTSLDMLIRQAEYARESLLKANRDVRELSRTQKYREDYGLLTSIPGIGVITAMTLLTEICDIGRFKNEKQFASYLGLVPTSHSSGEKTVHGEMTFRGNREIRSMLIEASWVAIGRDHRLGAEYLSLKKRMNPQKAIVRIARKMSNIIMSVLKNRKPYVSHVWSE